MADPERVLPPEQQDLYDHLKHVLDLHLEYLRKTPLVGDLIEETTGALDVLDALVADLKIDYYDPATAHGRLMNAIGRLNKTIPGVALRTLAAVNHYLATSDDDGVTTREKAMGIISDVGLTEDGAAMLKTFPPLP